MTKPQQPLAELEITEEMMRAGLRVLWTRDPKAGEDREIISDIFQAMLSARPQFQPPKS